ncbi:MAG: AzlD family protein [Actinomycetes bacterium]
MVLDPLTLFTIVLMAVVTYATRAGGLWLAARLSISGRAEAWLNHIPGAILVSIVAPTVLTSGLPEALAALAVVVVALRTGSLLASMGSGVAIVLVLRTLESGLA